eukprot:5311608-Pyramimonas_sp.AAC.1
MTRLGARRLWTQFLETTEAMRAPNSANTGLNNVMHAAWERVENENSPLGREHAQRQQPGEQASRRCRGDLCR